jgi:acetoin:2,6-dichlorophenolindophenol oxidoreductase subunit beta
MRELTIKDAINEALRQEMAADDRVVLFGEDIAGGAGRDEEYPEAADAWGGPFGVTQGLLAQFGRRRVVDTAIAETGFIGASVGAAVAGLRPVAEIMYVDFIGTSFDQLLNQAAKLRYVYGGKVSVPMVVRTVVGAGFRAAAEHSQTLYSLYTHIPGLKVVAPSTAYDAKGLLIAAIRDPDPVIFMEHKRLYMRTSEVPEEPYVIPLGQARIARGGDDVTVVGVQKMVHTALDAAETLAAEGISCEVIDPRTYSPLDTEAILRSVRKTGRLVVVDESHPRCSLATDISALAAEHAFDSLRAPIRQVTGAHAPVPFSPPLEDLYIPSAARVAEACREVVRYRSGGSARPLSAEVVLS